ncbi:hypothetical protein ABFX02_14G200100 [Erythranthe guttata]
MDWSKVAMDWSKVATDWSKVAIDWLKMIPVEGASCCLISAIFCAEVVFLEGHAKDLESATRVSKLKDLAQLCSAASAVVPLVVAVSGLVSSDTPIKCEYSGLKGVIVENKEETHILRRNFRGEWKKESILPSSVWNEVPWYLDDGTSRVRVAEARSVEDFTFTCLPMACGGEVFEKSIQTPIQEKIQLDTGAKTLGVHKIERVLPIGTCLTVVGEVIKDEAGNFVIQKPYGGHPFYVSYRSVSEIIENFRETSRFCMYASAAFGLIGVVLIAKHAFQYMEFKKMQKREAEYKRRLLDAAAAKQASRRRNVA